MKRVPIKASGTLGRYRTERPLQRISRGFLETREVICLKLPSLAYRSSICFQRRLQLIGRAWVEGLVQQQQ